MTMKPTRVKQSVIAQVAKRRGTTNERGYDADWERLRDLHKFNEPLCRHCLAKGLVVPMDEVDHIIDIAVRPDLRLDDANLQSLCKSCHSRKTRLNQNALARVGARRG
jgi:5-methylcytosine-specific restriction endonuclease McrA